MENIYPFFEKNLPTIFKSTCYNEKNIPFYKEILNTELGHLFEHMLLEKLCQLKILNGSKNATYFGFTSWNWEIENFGKFNINIKYEDRNFTLFNKALLETCRIFDNLLETQDSSKQKMSIVRRKYDLIKAPVDAFATSTGYNTKSDSY